MPARHRRSDATLTTGACRQVRHGGSSAWAGINHARGATTATMLASIDKAGRVVIPKEVRPPPLDAGTELELTVEGPTLRLARCAGRAVAW